MQFEIVGEEENVVYDVVTNLPVYENESSVGTGPGSEGSLVGKERRGKGAVKSMEVRGQRQGIEEEQKRRNKIAAQRKNRI